MKLINLTPHAVNIHKNNIEILKVRPAGFTPRVEECFEESEVITVYGADIQMFKKTYGDNVKDMPGEKHETLYIVSEMVKTALPHRTDLVSPGNLIRDSKGRVIGCEGLVY